MLRGPALEEVQWEKMAGKVVVLEFWDTQCEPCVAAIPHLNKLVEEFRQKPVVFLSVSGGNEDRVRNFLKRCPISGWVALDAPLIPTQSAFDVHGIPHTVIVNAAGRIAAITYPATLEARHLEEILAGKPCSLAQPQPPSTNNVTEVVSPVKFAKERPPLIEVSIRGPVAKPEGAFGFTRWKKSGFEFVAEKAGLKGVLAAYFRISPRLVIEEAKLPGGLYDLTVAGPAARSAELTTQFLLAVKSAFGIVVRTNNRAFDVYAMTLISTNAPGLKMGGRHAGGGEIPGGFLLPGFPMTTIATALENSLDRPVVDETQDTNRWGAELRWKMTPGEILKFQLRDQHIDRATIDSLTTLAADSLPQELVKFFSREDLAVLKAELLKPVNMRFRPDPALVIESARQQLGLDLKPVRRQLNLIEIRASE